MNKYEIIDPYQINEYVKKGYEFVTSYYESYTNTNYINGEKRLEGTFMNNPLSMTLRDTSTNTQQTVHQMPKFLMKLTPQGEVLFGEKS